MKINKLIFKATLCVLSIFVISSSVFAATFHVDAANGNDSNNGLSETTAWKTIAKVNASRFNPGDQILFKRGDIWREQLIPISSGKTGLPIYYGAYGAGNNPMVSGADVIKGWRNYNAIVWIATIASQPNIVKFGSIQGIRKTSKSSLATEYEWAWESGALYIYSTLDPNTAYISSGIQAGQRDGSLILQNVSFLVFENMAFEMSNVYSNIMLWSNTGDCVIRNCEVSYAARDGISFTTSTSGSNIIENCKIHHNLQGINGGIHKGSGSTTQTFIRGNEVYNNSQDGIHIRANYWIVENNIVHDNGESTDMYLGIHVYSGSLNEGVGKNNIIRRNLVNNQKGIRQDGAGIGIDQWCDKNEISFNIAFHNDGPGIYLFDAPDCSIINNTVYDNCQNSSGLLTEKGEIRLTSSAEPNALTNNVVVTNNIAYATTPGAYAIYIDTETARKNLSIERNDWYSSSINWFFWGGTGGNNILAWNNYSGGNDLNANPTFVDAPQHKFSLLSGSPCIGTGVNMGFTQDWFGNPILSETSVDIGAIQFKRPGAPTNLTII